MLLIDHGDLIKSVQRSVQTCCVLLMNVRILSDAEKLLMSLRLHKVRKQVWWFGTQVCSLKASRLSEHREQTLPHQLTNLVASNCLKKNS